MFQLSPDGSEEADDGDFHGDDSDVPEDTHQTENVKLQQQIEEMKRQLAAKDVIRQTRERETSLVGECLRLTVRSSQRDEDSQFKTLERQPAAEVSISPEFKKLLLVYLFFKNGSC